MPVISAMSSLVRSFASLASRILTKKRVGVSIFHSFTPKNVILRWKNAILCRKIKCGLKKYILQV